MSCGSGKAGSRRSGRLKRAGGRRYYRPSDVALLTGIKRLLHDEGMTIRGVQKILREQGIRHVAGLTEEPSPEEAALDEAMIARFDAEPALPPDAVEEETATALEAALEDAAPEPPAPAPQSTLDWLASLPLPAEEPPAAAPAQPDLPLEPPPDPAPRPALTVRSVTGAQVRSATEGDAAEATATLAARLRALPRGSLAGRRDSLAELAARMAALRNRLSGHQGR